MNDDPELLHRYVADRSEAAFASLVQRYLNLVYATALRDLRGDEHRAADVAQLVFTTLAKKAPGLTDHPMLAGWLHRTTRHVTSKIIRAEQRRAAREQEAYAMGEVHRSDEPTDWKDIRPLIDWALERLDRCDREAVLRRFFGGQTFAEISRALASSEPAVRMRINRALNRLRTILSRRGVASTTAALSSALAAHGAFVAPAGMVATITHAAVAGAASSGGLSILSFMSMTKVHAGIIGTVVLTGVLGTILQQRTHARLQNEFADVRGQRDHVRRLARENMRLTQGVENNRSTLGELVRLRAEAETLKTNLAEASVGVSPTLEPGIVPAAAWKNVGRATPAEAIETLLWAKAAVDIGALGKMITLDPHDRSKANDVFDQLPESVRAKLELTNPEELVGLMYAMIDPMAGAAVMPGWKPKTPPAANNEIMRTVIQRADGRIEYQDMQFHRTIEGWQWVIPRTQVEHGLNEIAREFLGYSPFPGSK